MIRILQNDVWKDKIDWKSLLKKHIKKYDEWTILFIPNDECYNPYIEFLES